MGYVLLVGVEIQLATGHVGVLSLSQPFGSSSSADSVHCLSDLATLSTTANAICTLTLAAFRRLHRQEGAFYHQTPNDPKLWKFTYVTLLHVCELKASFTFCIVLHGRNALIRLGDNYG